MENHRPTLLISGVLPSRPGNSRYDALAMRLMNHLISHAAPTWNVIREYAQLDGPEGSPLRAEQADAIVILGGEDVHPVTYGATQGYTNEGRHWHRADRAQIALVDYALRTGTPLLGICRGMQILNVACGGDLVQHIDGHLIPGILDHHRFQRHDVQLTPGSQLAAALGGQRRVEISSAHHQVAGRIGQDLRVAATSDDGLIEAVEHEWLPVLGVQWHPEDPAADVKDLVALLNYLHLSRRDAPVAPRTTLVA
ncbi:MAG: gamma-glutamyl-gamma-aminobutyrate hydrolase family protein [Actinomycetaceae bacterium]|nr:gamma-glutamyl-gamma-aminobutyrate hydrolase family protein [Actinomycetaceae bacterium]